MQLLGNEGKIVLCFVLNFTKSLFVHLENHDISSDATCIIYTPNTTLWITVFAAVSLRRC